MLTFAESLLPEFDEEVANARRVLVGVSAFGEIGPPASERWF